MREEGPKSQEFPVKFPLSRELQRESGSLETASTAIQSEDLPSLAIFRRNRAENARKCGNHPEKGHIGEFTGPVSATKRSTSFSALVDNGLARKSLRVGHLLGQQGTLVRIQSPRTISTQTDSTAVIASVVGNHTIDAVQKVTNTAGSVAGSVATDQASQAHLPKKQ
jgi:hypothetical protein